LVPDKVEYTVPETPVIPTTALFAPATPVAETETATSQQDPEITKALKALDDLREKARGMGIDVKPNWGVSRLNKEIEALGKPA
jgi:RecA-family ATPase